MIEEIEDNENSFVALWSEMVRLDCAVIYVSPLVLNDPFFNRVTDINCKEYRAMVECAENEFLKRNAKIFVQCLSDKKLEDELLKKNFVLYDSMSVLLHEARYGLRCSPDVTNKRVERDGAEEWTGVCCRSFGWESLEQEMVQIVDKSFDKLQFYLSYVKDSPAGCVALFDKNSILGLYCLGILPKYMKAGIRTALISLALDIARQNSLKLLVQSFSKGGLINYYVKRGFTQIYTKAIYTK
jgi:GNAT superfamily N-acetyltransferase